MDPQTKSKPPDIQFEVVKTGQNVLSPKVWKLQPALTKIEVQSTHSGGDGLDRLCAVLTGTMRLASVECGEICQSRADLQAKGSERTLSPADCIPPWKPLKTLPGVRALVGAGVCLFSLSGQNIWRNLMITLISR